MKSHTLSDGARVIVGDNGIYYVPAEQLASLPFDVDEAALQPFMRAAFTHDSVLVEALPVPMGSPLHKEWADIVMQAHTADFSARIVRPVLDWRNA